MNNDLEKAFIILKKGNYTCVLRKADEIYASREHGVKPLITFINGKFNVNGFSAVDKIVGKAAAFMYVLLGVKDVYADVMSESAFNTLKENNIKAECLFHVKDIINKDRTGICPMEAAVKDLSDPEEALKAIKLKLDELKRI